MATIYFKGKEKQTVKKEGGEVKLFGPRELHRAGSGPSKGEGWSDCCLQPPGAACLHCVINSLEKSSVRVGPLAAWLIENSLSLRPAGISHGSITCLHAQRLRDSALIPSCQEAPCACRKADSALERGLLPSRQLSPVNLQDTFSRTGTQHYSQKGSGSRGLGGLPCRYLEPD